MTIAGSASGEAVGPGGLGSEELEALWRLARDQSNVLTFAQVRAACERAAHGARKEVLDWITQCGIEVVEGELPADRPTAEPVADSVANEAGAYDVVVFATSNNSKDDDLPAATLNVRGATADPVRDYLDSVDKVALLDAEQEVELAKRIEAGQLAGEALDRGSYRGTPIVPGSELYRDLLQVVDDGLRAKHHMIEANLLLVVSKAKRYIGRGMPFMDLISEGNLGLIRAVEMFDYTKGNKFSTYAAWWVREAIIQALAKQARTIRVPAHVAAMLTKLARAQRQLSQELGREPTAEELATELDTTPEQIDELRQSGRDPLSIHTLAGEDRDTEFGDLIEDTYAIRPDVVLESAMLWERLEAGLDDLAEQERLVLQMRFGYFDGVPKSRNKIGAQLGLHCQRVRLIEGEALDKLRRPMRDGLLRDFRD